ncbi:hypothetical protein SUGI_0465120 [Cryptomeria japonica]|nr:hypothetical protein SUGI_0465120 [Cryptomeria japonica]
MHTFCESITEIGFLSKLLDMELERLTCCKCETDLPGSGHCNCYSRSADEIEKKLYTHNFTQVIRECINETEVPKQSEMHQNDFPWCYDVAESDIVRDICVYANGIQIYVTDFYFEYLTISSDSESESESDSIEDESVENDSRPSYTVPVRLMYWAAHEYMEPLTYPDSIIDIPGDRLHLQQILEDIESNKAELEWRLINVFVGAQNSYDFYFDYECHDDEDEEDDIIDEAPPADRSAVENLEREIIEENRHLCGICQATLLGGEIVLKMPCNHEYHERCISQWLETSNSCPTCNH